MLDGERRDKRHRRPDGGDSENRDTFDNPARRSTHKELYNTKFYDRRDGMLTRTETPGWLATKTLFSGGGGWWSTAEDYMRFAQMLVNGGELNGKRLLSPRTIDLMASNHVGDLYSGISQRVKGMGFGLTVEVVGDAVAAGRRVSNGTFGWGGAFGTHFWVDRKEHLVGLLMVQESVAQLRADLENAVMQAIVE
jgi:CubicO group peptidase (beta-lactamase class C family)